VLSDSALLEAVMPIYEYRCGACETKHEALQKMSDAPLTLCPECGKESLVKLVSAAGFQLKGNGWYATDFKNGNQPKAKTETSSSPAVSVPAAASKAGTGADASAASPSVAAPTTSAPAPAAPAAATSV